MRLIAVTWNIHTHTHTKADTQTQKKIECRRARLASNFHLDTSSVIRLLSMLPIVLLTHQGYIRKHSSIRKDFRVEIVWMQFCRRVNLYLTLPQARFCTPPDRKSGLMTDLSLFYVRRSLDGFLSIPRVNYEERFSSMFSFIFLREWDR